MPSGNVHDVVNCFVIAILGVFLYQGGYSYWEVGEFAIAGLLGTLIFSPDRIELIRGIWHLKHRGVSHSWILWGVLYVSISITSLLPAPYIAGAAVSTASHLVLDLLKDERNKIVPKALR